MPAGAGSWSNPIVIDRLPFLGSEVSVSLGSALPLSLLMLPSGLGAAAVHAAPLRMLCRHACPLLSRPLGKHSSLTRGPKKCSETPNCSAYSLSPPRPADLRQPRLRPHPLQLLYRQPPHGRLPLVLWAAQRRLAGSEQLRQHQQWG